MRVRINGEEREFGEGTTLAGALEEAGFPGSGLAVAVDGGVVPKASWPRTPLYDGMTIEVLTAVQGG